MKSDGNRTGGKENATHGSGSIPITFRYLGNSKSIIKNNQDDSAILSLIIWVIIWLLIRFFYANITYYIFIKKENLMTH